jgi:hypothetical protein
MHTKQSVCCTSEPFLLFLFFFKRQVLPSCSVQGVCILANGGINHPMAVTHETNPLRNFLLIWVQSQRNFTFRHPVYSELHFTTLSMSVTQNTSLSTSVTRTMFQFSSLSSSHFLHTRRAMAYASIPSLYFLLLHLLPRTMLWDEREIKYTVMGASCICEGDSGIS